MEAVITGSRDSNWAMGNFRPRSGRQTHPTRSVSTTCKCVVLNSCGRRAGRAVRGFSMVELAVALVIIAILLGSILVPLNTQVESRKYDETQRVLERARDALLGFVAANGRFPCPACASGTDPTCGTGVEDLADLNNGICGGDVSAPPVYIGFLPATTLGLTGVDSAGFAVDAWGLPQNRIRYAVSSATVTITRPFTKPNGMRTAGMSSIAGATTLLYVCNSAAGVTTSDCGTAGTLASSVPVVIWSVGPNSTTTGGASNDERQNPNPDPTSAGPVVDRIFVSKTKSGGPGDPNEFDDIVTWIGAPTLFNRLIAAGQLP